MGTNMKYKIWHIDAYVGWSDYDNPSDCNYHLDIIMDASFSKKQIIDMWTLLHKSERNVVIVNCVCINEGNIIL
jgi:hypothetical protein